ncbi:DUF7352 domain-containing protein [Alcanivorax quisquiliarum]|uniref:DUF7352 domain-containing protein n=1 Tax=Alcanivorax quisquiliarum TaxID=2933565 RepID=A0ABT0E7B9_9GAMM|nr:hypothetical protein [Alcanivorax quisquiliarum]MCK0537726.1 hypothetical protein [Alcanivorax quisquiliarum]
MKTIHKHRLKVGDEPQKIKLSPEGVIRQVAYSPHDQHLYLWAEVPAGSLIENSKTERCFRVFMTGDGIPDHAVFVGTALDSLRPESYHIFELTE